MTLIATGFLDIAAFFTLGTLWVLLTTFVVFLYRHLWKQELRAGEGQGRTGRRDPS